MLSGCNDAELQSLKLVRDPTKYAYTEKTGPRAGSEDRADYRATVSAFRTLKFTESDTDTVWRILAAILHLVSRAS